MADDAVIPASKSALAPATFEKLVLKKGETRPTHSPCESFHRCVDKSFFSFHLWWTDLSRQSLGADIVEIRVGTAHVRSFMVHKKLLCDKIPHFKKMFEGPWKATGEKIATFPEDDADAFDVLVCWVYNGQLPYVFDLFPNINMHSCNSYLS
jgi:hypothetical protein